MGAPSTSSDGSGNGAAVNHGLAGVGAGGCAKAGVAVTTAAAKTQRMRRCGDIGTLPDPLPGRAHGPWLDGIY
jgi:hypothetical protein